jgi:mannose-6-phosphate isomerase-like protein (cupin superfamily)
MRTARYGLGLLLALGAASAALAEPPDGASTSFASAAQVQAQVAAMAHDMKPGETFLYRPLLQAGASKAALEYWTGPRPPAVHPSDAEYVVVVAGAGTLVSGGVLENAVARNPGLTEGSRIEGGSTRALAVGDAFMVPAGVPHWFGIAPGGRLVMLGIKLPQPKP